MPTPPATMTAPVADDVDAVVFVPVITPLVLMEVNVPTDVIAGCAAVVTVPAVVALVAVVAVFAVNALLAFVAVVAVFVIVKLSLLTAAEDETVERTPKPNAATVTSAIRLKVVFVDICFLSFVAIESFSAAAWNELVIPSRCIARADASNSPPCIRTR